MNLNLLAIQKYGVLVIIPKYSHEQVYSCRKHKFTCLVIVAVQAIEPIAFVLNYAAF